MIELAFPPRPPSRAAPPRPLRHRQQRLEQIQRHRKDYRGVVLNADVVERLQIAQLQGLRLGGDDLGGLADPLGGLELALGVDDLGPPLALGLGLAGDGADHALVDIDALDFHVGDLDSPHVGFGVQNVLDVPVQFVPPRQHLVHFVLAQHRAQRGLRQLAGGVVVILDLNDGPLRVDHPEVDHRVHLDRDVVAGNHVLAGYVHDDGA